MATSSSTQNSKPEPSEPATLGNDYSKKETESRQGGPIAMMGKLSASAVLMIGVIYVLGYVIVNGYQAKYMNYSANALQLKHLAAGVLYTMLTSFQVCVLTFFLLSGVIEAGFAAPAAGNQAAKRKNLHRFWDRTKYIGKYSWSIGKGLLLALFFSLLFLQFVGMSLAPTRLRSLVLFKEILPWVVINLLLSAAIVIGLYSSGSKNFEIAFREARQREDEDREQASPEQATSKQKSDEEDGVTSYDAQQARRVFIEAQMTPLVITLASFVLLFFSLVFFQPLYGRLMPNYGGGALYRVAIHLKSIESRPSPSATPSTVSTPSPDGPSADWKESIKSKDSWLLFVDKDGSFVYVLRVDRLGNKQLLEIASGEIEAVEILADPPISPTDARFFIQ